MFLSKQKTINLLEHLKFSNQGDYTHVFIFISYFDVSSRFPAIKEDGIFPKLCRWWVATLYLPLIIS